MTSNFKFLQEGWREIYQKAIEAERHAIIAPVTSAFYSRLSLELMVNWLYEHDGDLTAPYQATLSARMYEQTFRDIIPPTLYQDIHYIRRQGNTAAHTGKMSRNEAMASLQFLFRFTSWIVKLYSEERPQIAPFDERVIPRKGVAEKNLQQLKNLQEQVEAHLEALDRERRKRMEIEAELEKYRRQAAEVKAVKEKNKAVEPAPAPLSESETRKLFIDAMLREAGWDPQAPNVSEYPLRHVPVRVNKTGRGKADYVLWGDNGRPLAVIEAKRTSVDEDQGKIQAEVYADCLEKMHGQRPVIFYTNGFNTSIWDDTFYPPRPVQGFYTKEELQLLVDRRNTRRDLRRFKANKDIAGRHYQLEAIQRVAETFAGDRDGRLAGRSRAALIVMATGAGKTRTSAAIVEMLVKSNWVKRVLFLADRNALVTQAQNAYKRLLPNLTSIDLTKEKEDDGARLVFSTYPTIMNRIDRARNADERFYGVGHFDLIIVDEAHRSVYQKYKAIFDYFDALLLGLTATPRSEADRDTYELFDCEEHNPTAYYELDQAVNDGYLVPPKGKEFNLGFIRRGIRYKDLSPEEKDRYESTFRDEHGNIPEEIGSAAINEWLFNSDTIDKVLDALIMQGLKIEGGDKLGKTIIFARNHAHALEIEKRFNKQYPQYGGKFCKVIDNYNKFAQQTIDDFSSSDKYPQIAVSVDMLDTGIDIPEILNLVFFKPVYSSAKYWQMIGRGTRLCPGIFGEGEDKAFFYIFDFCGNFEFFDHRPNGLVGNVPESVSQRLFTARMELAQLIREKKMDVHDAYRHQLLDWCHAEVEHLFEQRQNFRIRMNLQYIDKYRDRNRWSGLSYQEMSEIAQYIAPLVRLRDEDEQAKRFDILLLQLEAAGLNGDLEQASAAMNRVSRIGERLREMSNIPAIREQLDRLNQTQRPAFWEQAGLSDLEDLRENIRSLVRLIPKQERPVYRTDFQDTLESAREVTLLTAYRQMENYKQRVEKSIRDNRRHITIQKLRNNEPITPDELAALERMLFDGEERGTKEDFVQEYGEKPLGEFILRILGMEVNAAKAAFAEFLNRGNLRADQMTFINYIIDHLTQNGVIQKRALVQPPFTDIHDMGIFGLFEPDDQARIVRIIDRINGNISAG